jgi:hypothetical protein
MEISEVPAFGWNRCLRLASAGAEVLVSIEVGPRILSYRRPDGENVLRAYPEQMGTSGEDEYMVRGGHRIWVSPETEITYAPDNSAVTVEQGSQGAVRLVNKASTRGPVRKELTLSLAEGGGLTLDHRLVNESGAEMEIASWGLTVMREGGYELIPQPPLGSHETDLLPNRVIVPWTYTDFSDDRWQFGRHLWRLIPKPGRPPTKLGFALLPGWAGYVLPGTLFVKRFDYEPGAVYPDRGCNFETFSKDDFIELESLSPLRRLAPGEAVSHRETWHLFGSDTTPPAGIDDAALEQWLRPLLSPLGVP